MSCISEEVAHAEDCLASHPALPLPCYAQTPEQMSAGRRATLLLKLQDARRDLAELRERRQACLEFATVCRADACSTENPHRRIALNASAVRFQLDAEADYRAIWDLTQTIGSIERSLNAGRVVLSAEVCAAVDDTMNAETA